MKRPAIALSLLPLFLVTAHAEEKPRKLTFAEARTQVLRRHPRVTAADLTARATQEVVNQNRAAYMPQLSGSLAGVDTNQLKSGGIHAATGGESLQLSGIYNRASGSINLTQLITDFGRTSNLTASSRLQAKAETENTHIVRAQIMLETDTACYSILQAQALVGVADQTLKTRKLMRDNTLALQKNQLKSAIDVSFAEVNLQDAELLVSRARNDLKSAHAMLARLLLEPEGMEYEIATPMEPVELPPKADGLIKMAENMRPELAKLRLERDAALKFVKAENALSRPRLSLLGTVGTMPWRDQALNQQNYAAVGVVLTWPLFTGGLNSARQNEAELRAQAADQVLRDEQARIARDVKVAWLNATNSQERLSITERMRAQATQAYALAEARYNVGSSSVVELSQAQLGLTAAQINQTTTRYEYLLRRSILDFQSGMLFRQLKTESSKGE